MPSDDSQQSEDSPLSFRLLWNVESLDRSAAFSGIPSLQRVSWINRQKLEELKIKAPTNGHSYSWISLLLVLELNGPAYEREQTFKCRPIQTSGDGKLCDPEQDTKTRLYIMDAGRQLEELRRRYPDRTRYAIVHGTIKIAPESPAGEIVGYIGGLDNETVQGSEPLRSAIDQTNGDMLWHRLTAAHSFNVSVAFGRRLEPWVLSVKY